MNINKRYQFILSKTNLSFDVTKNRDGIEKEFSSVVLYVCCDGLSPFGPIFVPVVENLPKAVFLQPSGR